MLNQNLTTVLFDLDGTLLDTAPDLAFALNQVLQNNGRQPLPFADVRPLASAGTRGLLGAGFHITESHADYNRLRLEFLQTYHDHLFRETQLFPGIEEVLAEIEKRNLRWGIVTNKPTNLSQELLVHFKLAQRTACIVGADIVAHRKPAPDSLLLACELIDVSPQQCIYVGDAKRDIEAAHAANMPAVAALYGYIENSDNPKLWQADEYVKNPEDLIRLIK